MPAPNQKITMYNWIRIYTCLGQMSWILAYCLRVDLSVDPLPKAYTDLKEEFIPIGRMRSGSYTIPWAWTARNIFSPTQWALLIKFQPRSFKLVTCKISSQTYYSGHCSKFEPNYKIWPKIGPPPLAKAMFYSWVSSHKFMVFEIFDIIW